MAAWNSGQLPGRAPFHMLPIVFVVVASVLLSPAAGGTTFSADVSSAPKPFTHVIEKCFGSGHALLGLREDWRVYLVSQGGLLLPLVRSFASHASSAGFLESSLLLTEFMVFMRSCA